MDSIEMTDPDGDALTLLTSSEGTWITCTSGADEVTVGPFPTQLLHRLLAPGISSDQASTLLSLSGTAHLDAAGEVIDELPPESGQLAEQYRRIALAFRHGEVPSGPGDHPGRRAG